MNIQEILKRITALGISQQEIANFCSCTQATISIILNGKVKDPSYSIASSIIEFARQKGVL